MKIVVPLKIAGSPDEAARIRNNQLEESSLEYDMNEWDRFALEAALELTEANGGEVTVISIGGDEVEDGQLAALAMGAHHATQISVEDERNKLDAISTARVLAKALESEIPDLILCGVMTSDGISSGVGTALAALLDLPRVAVVSNIQLSDGRLTVARELEGGLVQRIELSTPALLTIQTGINEPRYANLRGIRAAASKPREEKSIEDLGLDEHALAGSSAKVVALAAPPDNAGAEILEGDGAAVAARIAQIIKSKVGS